MAEATVKVIFGEKYPGDIRVMLGAQEVPNIKSVKLLEVEPGELPELQIRMLTPKLEILDHTDGEITEMEEVDLSLSPAEKGVAAGQRATVKSTPSNSSPAKKSK